MVADGDKTPVSVELCRAAILWQESSSLLWQAAVLFAEQEQLLWSVLNKINEGNEVPTRERSAVPIEFKRTARKQ